MAPPRHRSFRGAEVLILDAGVLQGILNLKKPVVRRGLPQWDYKEQAIKKFAAEIAAALPPARATWAIVPMPPHCSRDDAEHDDRMERVAEIVANQRGWPHRALLHTRQTRQPLHATNYPRDPAQIADTLEIDEALANPEPEGILLLDDVLTTGCSIVAASLVLRRRFPTAEIFGIFIARRVFPKPELDDDGWLVIGS